MMRFITTLVVVTSLVGTPRLAQEMPDLGNEKARVNYSVGYQIGDDFKRQGVEINPEIVVKGIHDALSGQTPLMSAQEQHATLVNLQQKVDTQQEPAKSPPQTMEYHAEGRDFLAENARNEDIQSTKSGLQYRIVRTGTGKIPGPTDTVTVNYRGTLIDGKEFDSSYRRGQPATFRVDRVIRGWTEALQLMREGAKWQLFIPPELAYGDKKIGDIQPNSTLIFDVELISVESSDK